MNPTFKTILKPRHENFTRYLFEGKSQYEAYKLSYPKAEKWARSSVDSSAANLAKDPKIQARLAEMKAYALKRSAATVNEVLSELSAMATVNLGDMFDADGNQLPFHEWPRSLQQSVVGIDYKMEGMGDGVQQRVPVYKFAKEGALDKLMRHLGQYNDKLQVEGINLTAVQAMVQAKLEKKRGGSGEKTIDE